MFNNNSSVWFAIVVMTVVIVGNHYLTSDDFFDIDIDADFFNLSSLTVIELFNHKSMVLSISAAFIDVSYVP